MSEAQNREEALVATDIHIQATYRLTEALVAAEKKMRRRVQLLSEVVFEADGEGRLLFLNTAWTTTMGFSEQSSLGSLLRDYILDEDRPVFDQALECARTHACPGPVQLRMRKTDGEIAWMECSATALQEGGFVGALRDITRQKLAQDEVAKLSLVASSTDNMVIITDSDGLIEWVNHAFTRRTGYEIEEIRGRKPGAFLQGPGSDQNTIAQIGKWLAQGVSFDCELLNYTKSGEPYWAAINVTPVRDDAGRIQRFISVQTDSTKMRRTQQELKAAKEAAESANDAKTHFLATISHEMRTPLNVILGATELALEGGQPSFMLRQLQRINDSGETLLRLITDLLDISKIEAGQIEFERVPFKLRECLNSALEPIRLHAVNKGLDFHILCDQLLPPVILGDPGRLRQIITNLAENAIKFTEHGHVRIQALLAKQSEPVASWLEICVSDTGAGIPFENQQSIFERFVQGDNSITRSKGGAGLGLSIVKSLVEGMGGSVSVRSSKGTGAAFYVRIPLAVPEVPGRLNGNASSRHSGTHPGNPNAAVRILVAEDNDDNFAIVERHLSRAGYMVDRAVNGRIACENAASNRYNLILMDVEMPEMDGLDATRRIRSQETSMSRPPVPILALTAHAVQGYRERCLQAGCTSYLAKPVRKPALLEAVSAVLRQSVEEEIIDEITIDPDLADLVPRYLESCRRGAQNAAQDIQAGNWDDVFRFGHGIKGAAPSYGFRELGKLGRELEEAATARNADGVTTAADRILRHLQGIRIKTM